MKVVIDIDKGYYELMKYEVDVCHNDYKPIVLIAEGKPLPKGHGRLIDADDIPNQIELKGFLQQDDAHLVTIQSVKEALDEAPTIIEAESEVQDADSD